jgi:ribosomal protein S18 acetylase RimI-like enzyme
MIAGGALRRVIRVPSLVVAAAEPADAGEILTLQRAAYVTEAQLYGDPLLPPLTEPFPAVLAAITGATVVKAVLGHRIVGAGRAAVDGSTLHIGRLVVAPDQQGRGIGTRLLLALEAGAPASVRTFSLFTGHRSAANLRLYERLGYREYRRERIGPAVELVHLAKPAS